MLSYLQQLRQNGENINKQASQQRVEELRHQDPCEAYKYFLEYAELFDPGEAEVYAQTLLEGARQVRIAQALNDGVTTGIVLTHGTLQETQTFKEEKFEDQQ